MHERFIARASSALAPSAAFVTFDAAKRHVIRCMLQRADELPEARAAELTHAAEDVNLESGPFWLRTADGNVYGVTRHDQD